MILHPKLSKFLNVFMLNLTSYAYFQIISINTCSLPKRSNAQIWLQTRRDN